MGAKTAQIMIGQRRWLSSTRKEKRIRADVLMSPNSSSPQSAKSAFGLVTTPCPLLTGTRDSVPSNDQSIEFRRAVFPALPSGNAYELVLYNVTHCAFSDRSLRKDPPRNSKRHLAIEVITTAFWDAICKVIKRP